jgi:hypothetical protein
VFQHPPTHFRLSHSPRFPLLMLSCLRLACVYLRWVRVMSHRNSFAASVGVRMSGVLLLLCLWPLTMFE